MPFRHSCFTSTIAEMNLGFLFQGDAYYIIEVEDSAKLLYVLALFFSSKNGRKTAENDIRKIVFRWGRTVLQERISAKFTHSWRCFFFWTQTISGLLLLILFIPPPLSEKSKLENPLTPKFFFCMAIFQPGWLETKPRSKRRSTIESEGLRPRRRKRSTLRPPSGSRWPSSQRKSI